MDSTNVIVNVLSLFSGFAPIFGLLVVRIPAFNRKYWYVLSELGFGLITVFLLGWWIPISDTVNSFPFVLFFYPLFIMGFLAVLTKRFGVEQFSKVLAVSLMLGFLTTEIHEIPEFVFGIFNMYGHTMHPMHPLSHIYCIVVFILAVKLANVKFSRKLVLFSAACVIYLFVQYFMCPRTWFLTQPLPTIFGNFCACGRRPLPFLWLSVLFYYGTNIALPPAPEQH